MSKMAGKAQLLQFVLSFWTFHYDSELGENFIISVGLPDENFSISVSKFA